MTAFERTSFLYRGNNGFIEELYDRWLADPKSVDDSWAAFFAALGDEQDAVKAELTGPSWGTQFDWRSVDEDALLGPAGTATKSADRAKKGGASPEMIRQAALDTIRAAMMIRAFRIRGHLQANLDPLGIEKPGYHPELDPKSYGFNDSDFDRPIFIDYMLGLETATIREILALLQRTYCSTIGVEFMHMSDPAQKSWLQARIEGREKEVSFTREGKRAILNKLIEGEYYERFCATKYTGTKRFGLEGGEALIPAMEAIIKRGGQLGVQEIVLGMPHRGRLNVLANVMAKPYRAIFSEFQGQDTTPDGVEGSGDVKYHLGTSSDREFDGNKVHLSLTANPSHLEAVNPVVNGKARAKQEQLNDHDRTKVLSILLHGDAAFAGQGIIAECFAMSDLKGYRTGGTIHIIVNNQIGFTTSPKFSRSSPYPSDGAKGLQTPIFHVNGDDPEAVVHVSKIATEFRQQFHRDVVIDMFCYRRHGHNETDEPAFTQPLMYREIARHPTTRQVYEKRLIDENVITEAEAERMIQGYNAILETDLQAAKGYKPNKADWLEGRWSGLSVADNKDDRRGKTDVSLDILKEVGTKLFGPVPQGFNLHRTLDRIRAKQLKAIEDGEGLDWATGELLAYGTLLLEGFPIRLSGEDVGRGTFSHRHAVLTDQQTEEHRIPLNHLKDGQRQIEIVDSLLSELAVLGFEYGYSLAEPNALVIWEAQFGDFANGAQVMFDQFIATGESKWQRMSGLVMMLPHGYEGAGPEHSSARLERWLQLSAEDNWQVVNVTQPANYFHCLRRQLHRPYRKPLVVMTPKSLLRHKHCVSKLSDFGPGTTFHRVLWDDFCKTPDAKIKRLVLCSGKIYFDLVEEREKRGQTDTYILRLEQLYPFPFTALAKELARFKNIKSVVWCQEEPKNMGAWWFIESRIERSLTECGYKVTRPAYAGRPEAASPATGLHKRHVAEQAKLVDDALTI